MVYNSPHVERITRELDQFNPNWRTDFNSIREAAEYYGVIESADPIDLEELDFNTLDPNPWRRLKGMGADDWDND